MFVFEINDPNEGLGRVMRALNQYGIRSDSRNGPVIRFPQPACLEYPDPRRRILDHPIRAANHFFHLFETMWMFAGLDTVAPLDLYNSGMKQYSDDGIRFAAAYGHRWRYHFGFDQIITAIDKLRKNPVDRRIVIQMWDPQELAKESGLDFACNQQVLLDTRPDGQGNYILDMTVTNRSNDLIYGAMGSNLFHFSMLHEYIALHAGLQIGTYYQISKNLHLYLENPASARCWEHMDKFENKPSPPKDMSLTEYGLTLDPGAIEYFVNTNQIFPEEVDGYLGRVVQPITNAYREYKGVGCTEKPSLVTRIESAMELLGQCHSSPLGEACTYWFKQALENARKKQMARM